MSLKKIANLILSPPQEAELGVTKITNLILSPPQEAELGVTKITNLILSPPQEADLEVTGYVELLARRARHIKPIKQVSVGHRFIFCCVSFIIINIYFIICSPDIAKIFSFTFIFALKIIAYFNFYC